VVTRYEVTLLGNGKYITTRLSASSIQHLAEMILRLHPGTTFVSAKELSR
jgi:hypothetical protein